jgi:iron transport multicopper oxidase
MRAVTCLLTGLISLTSVIQAARVVFDMNITYVDNVNPDNLFPRQVVGINGVWP